MPYLKLKYPRKREFIEEHGDRYCVLCGKAFRRYELDFNSGSVEPQVGEILTGGTSAETGTVDEVQRVGGSWAAGTAHGTIRFTETTGSDDFEVSENVNGSIGGANILTVLASVYRNHGRRYPDSQLVTREGKDYCLAHYRFRYHHKDLDSQKIKESYTESNE